MKTTLLIQKPIKKMPEVLIYNVPNTGRYNMFSSKEGRRGFVGVMDLSVDNFKGQDALKIVDLLIFEREKGYGSYFINFAKALSRKFFGGRVFLEASTLPIDPFAPPHVFYRKHGFTTDNEKVLKKIDQSLKKQKQLSYFDAPNTIMYFPSEEAPKKNYFHWLKSLL